MATVAASPLLSIILTEYIKSKESEKLPLANWANAASILMQNIPNINWAGFYFYDENLAELTLGPFVGKPATVRIKPGTGVVGTAYANEEVLIVKDVHEFAGHITCDPDSKSEIVLPIVKPDGTKVGVLDIDAPIVDRFGAQEQADLEHFINTLLQFV